MADFSKDVNVDLNTTPFDSVVFGSGAPLLEVELNEAQKLQSEKLERFFRNFTGNMICDQNFITIKNGSFAIDGYIIYDGKLLKMNDITISGATEGATIYIYTETKVVDKDTNITKNGYVNGEKIKNTVADDRIGAETSKRTATFYNLAVGTSIKGTTIASVKDGKIKYTDDFPIGNLVTIGSMNTNLDTKAERKYYGDTTVSVGRIPNSTVGINSFAFGSYVTASGESSHAEGGGTTALGSSSHAEGGGTTALGSSSHAEGNSTTASGNYSHTEGAFAKASGECSHAEGSGTTAIGNYSHAEGNSDNILPSNITSKSTDDEILERWNKTKFSLAKGSASHVEGINSLALGDYSHAEGQRTTAKGSGSHVEGSGTIASGNYSHTEGSVTIASGNCSHAEGSGTTASGSSSHSEGNGTKASGSQSHAEGYYTTALGSSSHAEGYQTTAEGNYSHVEGSGTKASGLNQHVEGRYNEIDNTAKNKYIHIIGNGISSTKRSNAHTVDWDGNAWYAGGMDIDGENGLTLRDSIDASASVDIPAKLYTRRRALILTAPYNNSIPDNGKESSQGAGLELRSCVEGILPIAQSTNNTWSPNLDLGDSSRPFGTIYCTHTSSDKKIKKDVENLSENDLAEKYVEILDLINFVKFRWKHNMNGGMETPQSFRYHYGIIAQEIEKLLKDIGIGTYDNGIIRADFFAKNTSNAFITGGYREQFENEENGVTYDYSKNTYDFKKGNDYSVYNEILDKELSALNRCNGYTDRSNIGYLMVEDNSKLSEKYENRPPVTIKGIILIDKEGNTKKLSIDFDKCISYYEWNDENLSNPKTSGTLNEDGSVTVSFNKKYSTYMIKVDDFNFFDYERIVLDVDYVGEYKVYLIPNATEEHVNANVYDRDRVDDIMLNYHVDYQELQILCLHALQQKSKKQASEIANLRKEIEELKGMMKNA